MEHWDPLGHAAEVRADLRALVGLSDALGALQVWPNRRRPADPAANEALVAEHRALHAAFMDLHEHDMAGDLDRAAHARLRARLDELAADVRTLLA